MNLLDQITRTKVLLPRRRPDLLSRQRLLELLLDFLDCKLVIIAAPAGYGKTSLLVDMAHQLEMPVCWYALDSLDRDPQRFILHFIASIAHAFPRFGQRSWAAIQGGIVGLSDLDRLARTIVNETLEHIREHFVLVLDDYHLVDDSEEIGYFVNRFIQQADENCHLVIASRTLLTLPDLPLLVARSQVGGLSFEELAFRADEIQALMSQNHQMTLPESVAQELARETEGWITGLLLSTQIMWQGMADRLRVARVSGVGLYEYLAQQVLEQQPASVRDFLLHTSLMEEFDAELCEAVLGPAQYPGGQDWQGLIQIVLRNNLFVLPVGDKGTWLRYHHLFRDFLQTRLAQEQPDKVARILRRMAAVHSERGEWEKAYALFQRLHDPLATADLIEQAGLWLLRAGRLKTLAEWLIALPAEMLISRPNLLSLHGMVRMMLGDVEQGVDLQNQAAAAFREANDLPGLARTLVRRATDQRMLGHYQASLADADEALAIARANPELRDVEAEASRVRGVSLYQVGRLKEAIEWIGQSLAVYDRLDDAQRIAMLHMELGLAYVSAGRYTQASVHYNHALDYWRKSDNIAQQANLLNNLGVLYHLRGDYEQASSLLEEALACAERSEYTRAKAFALTGIGDLYADLEAIPAASAAYSQARETSQNIDDHFLLLYLDLAEASLARSKDDLARASELIESAGRLAQQSGSAFEQGLYQLEAGRLALTLNSSLEAIAHIEGAARRFDDDGQQIEAARAHLYLAVAYHTVQDQKAMANHLGNAFQLVSEMESQHVLVIPGREAKGLLAAVAGDSTPGRQSSRLLKQIVEFEHNIPALRRRLRRQASAVPFASPKLNIQALGKAQITVDGKLITNADWQGQAARDLFFYLLAHSEGLTKETVGNIFWPDSSPAQLKLKFKNAIYRLRQALGVEAVLFDGNHYQFNQALDYEYDVETFSGKLAQAQAATDPAEQAAAYQAAIRLYKGSYLPEVEGEWAWWQRESLQQAFQETILKLAEINLEAGEYPLALDYCQRALTEDSCLEEAHRLAMRAHAALGNRAAIVRQFESCRQALLNEVNVPPSSQTVSLYETLMR
jgi:ATP/maltotriose-dependent transcriptional regulator MalT/two-component SAPR family response regulator